MLISVIVPVYNVQDYIRDCVESILKQEEKNFELLLVDDGSTDQSGIICDKLQSEDSRIHVFHKPNGGLSDARNFGIEKARGDFLAFIDSDDFVFPGYLKCLMELIEKYEADVACMRLLVSSNRTQTPSDENTVTGSFTGTEAVKNSLLINLFGVSACGKLFKACLFTDIKYPKGKLFEDLLTIPYVFERCDCVAYTTESLYFYYNRPGSITHTKITEKHLALLDDSAELIHYLDLHCPEAHDAGVVRFCIDSIKRLVDILLITDGYSTYIKTIQDKSLPYWREGLKNNLLPYSIKIQVAILSRSSILYKLLFKPYKLLKSVLGNNIVN